MGISRVREVAEAQSLRLPETTRGTWFIGWSPLLQVFVHGLLLAFGVPLAWLQILAVALLWMPFAVVAARADAAALTRAGATATASPWFVLLTPIAYFVARGKTSRDGMFDAFKPIGGHVIAVGLAIVIGLLVYLMAAFALRTGTHGY